MELPRQRRFRNRHRHVRRSHRDGAPLSIDAQGVRLDDPTGDPCVDYTVDLAAAATEGNWEVAARAGSDLIGTPDLWLLRPARVPREVDATARFVLPPGLAAAVPWPPHGEGHRLSWGAFEMTTHAALGRFDSARLPYISVLADPTTGGVTASYAMLGDLNIAEPGALIGFAGPRVIEQTIRQKLPEGFQRSEFLLEHGMLDMVVDRRELKKTLARGMRLLAA